MNSPGERLMARPEARRAWLNRRMSLSELSATAEQSQVKNFWLAEAELRKSSIHVSRTTGP